MAEDATQIQADKEIAPTTQEGDDSQTNAEDGAKVEGADTLNHYNTDAENGGSEYAWLNDPDIDISDKISRLSTEMQEIKEEHEATEFKLDFGDTEDDEKTYKDRKRYLEKVLSFVNNDIEYIDYDFFTVELLHHELNDAIKSYQEDEDIYFKSSVVTGFISLAMKTTKRGYNSVNRFKYLIKPFNQTYALQINPIEQRYNDLNQAKETLQERKKQEQQMAMLQQQQQEDLAKQQAAEADNTNTEKDTNG